MVDFPSVVRGPEVVLLRLHHSLGRNFTCKTEVTVETLLLGVEAALRPDAGPVEGVSCVDLPHVGRALFKAHAVEIEALSTILDGVGCLVA